MRRRAVVIGAVAGLIIGGAIAVIRSPLGRPEPVPLVEDSGQIKRVVLQYHPDAGPLVAPIYAQFLSAVGRDVQVVLVVARQSDADDLQSLMGAAWPAGRCHIVVTGKDISTWSKDRFVAMRAPGGKGLAVLCAPTRTRSPNPLRTNDQEVPYRLAQDPCRLFGVRGATADFDGGDFLATAHHLFAGPAIIDKNIPRAGSHFHTVADLMEYLSREMSTPITWLSENSRESPPHHLGMFLTVIGNTAAVGDVRMAEKVVAAHPETLDALRLAGGPATPKFRADLFAQLENVASLLRSLGYQVVRVPLLPSATPKAWMSYNNGIVETRPGETTFYMPTFGAPALDAAAAEVFRSRMGCAVVPIDCSRVWPLGGSLHCLVNVVERDGM